MAVNVETHARGPWYVDESLNDGRDDGPAIQGTRGIPIVVCAVCVECDSEDQDRDEGDPALDRESPCAKPKEHDLNDYLLVNVAWTSRADANLIAAAPDLYRAVLNAVRCIESSQAGHTVVVSKYLDPLRSALAKVGGR